MDTTSTHLATVIYSDQLGRERRRRTLETAVGFSDGDGVSAANEGGAAIFVVRLTT